LTWGVDQNKIVAAKGPFSKEMYTGFINHYDINVLVARDSGEIGGTKNKVLATLESKKQVVIISRPNLEYENVVCGVTELVFLVGKIISSRDD
jgi:precorrin-6A/cobalt-precorrin-6A reductase